MDGDRGHMDGPARQEPVGDISHAMRLVTALSAPGAEPSAEIRKVRDRVDPAELVRGLATLIHAFMGVFDDSTEAVMPVVRRLRSLELVPDHLLPTMGAILIAAAVSQPASPGKEPSSAAAGADTTAWASTAWLLAELVERTAGEGAAAACARRLGA